MSVKFIECNNLKRMDLISHGFFTNNGGVSSGVYASLNCGPGSSDDPNNVIKNRQIAMQALGFEGESKLYSLYQIHSNKVVAINNVPDVKYEADAMVTNTPGLALGILTADCTPVLFADDIAGVVGAAHAGWKGAMSGVLENTIAQMEKLGAQPANIKAAIGPTIAQKSYEVGQEFYDRFLEEHPDNNKFFVTSARPAHFMFNLPAYVTARLQQAGIAGVEDCAIDTCADSKNFFSYRRNCLAGIKDYGRNLAVIGLINYRRPLITFG